MSYFKGIRFFPTDKFKRVDSMNNYYPIFKWWILTFTTVNIEKDKLHYDVHDQTDHSISLFQYV